MRTRVSTFSQEVCNDTYHESCGSSLPSIPRKHFIENTINNELERLVDSTNITVIDKWYLNQVDCSETIPNYLVDSLSVSEMYLNTIENHLSSMLQEARQSIQNKKEIVTNKMEKRKINIEARNKKAPTIKEKEISILKRMQLLPDDLIRYIADFAFTPGMRIIFIQQKYMDVTPLFARIKSPNLTNMISSIYKLNLDFRRIIKTIESNGSLIKYKATSKDPVYESILFVRGFRMNRTDTKKKKLLEYPRLVNAYEDIINYYRQFTKRSYIKMQLLLIKFYHNAVYIADHKCNKRG